MTTTSRLLMLLSFLQMRRDWQGQVLADRLGVSQRTVRRDVDRLRAMGYNIHATMGPEGGYRLDAGKELPPLLFDDEQVIALAVALQAATATGAGIEDAAVRALTTVRHVMPARLRHRLDGLQFTVIPPRSRTKPVAPEVLLDLSMAIRNREVLRFDYASLTPERDVAELVPPRRVEPVHLVTSHRRWYLVAWDLKRDDWRIFRADRITPRIPRGPHFVPREIPGGSVHDYVEARFKNSKDVNAWPCRGKVILNLPAREVLPFAVDGVVEDLGPDRCSLEAGAWSWIGLAASLSRYDADIEVVGPPELLDAFDRLAARCAKTASHSPLMTDSSPQTDGQGRRDISGPDHPQDGR